VTNLPLTGVKVLEVAGYFFVPAAGAVLADWGAEVIKVEHPVRGDTQRSIATRWRSQTTATRARQEPEAGDFRPVYEQGNRGKRAIGLDLATPQGLAVLTKLVERSDVFLTNLLPGSRKRLGIEAADIRAANPSIIYACGSGNGRRGPGRDQGGFEDTSFWSRTGVASAATPPDYSSLYGTPTPAFGDAIAGATLAGGIAAALYQRATTGEGAEVDASLLGVGMWANGATTALSLHMDQPWVASPVAEDCSVPGNPLFGAYRTRDGRWLFLCMPRIDAWWPEVCRRVDREDLIDDPRFGTFEALQDNAEEARTELRAEFARRDFAEWLDRLEPMKGAWSPVWDTVETVNDSQVRANDYVATLTDGGAGEHGRRIIRNPVEFDGSPPALTRAPLFAEHTDEIMTELGFTVEEMLDLKIAGTIT
jgi:crotonobetainyl-CoA:carnitine CoA-transferase CaiB-like acyl-CoA transferase